MNTCNFCKKEFKSLASLKKHKLVAKFCLKIQGEISQENNIFKCNDCEKVFKTKKNLESHLMICKHVKKRIDSEKDIEINKLKKDISLKDEKIEELKKNVEITEAKLEMYRTDHECIQEIAKQPKISNTLNNMNNKYNYLTPLILSSQETENIVEEKFTEKYFLNGQQGVADFTYENILLDENNNSKLICTDTSRHEFMSKNKDGLAEQDYKVNNLLRITHPPILKKSEKISTTILSNNPDDNLIKTECIKNFKEIKSLKKKNTEYISRLTLRLMSTQNIDNETENSREVDDKKEPIYLTNIYMNEQSEFLTIEHVLNRLDGFVQYALDYPFKNTLYCSNTQTKKMHYSISEGNVQIETGGESICKRFFKSIEKKYFQLYNDFRIEIEDDVEELQNSTEEIETDEEMDEILNKIDEINKPLEIITEDQIEIRKILNGKPSNFLDEFINEICKRTLIDDCK